MTLKSISNAAATSKVKNLDWPGDNGVNAARRPTGDTSLGESPLRRIYGLYNDDREVVKVGASEYSFETSERPRADYVAIDPCRLDMLSLSNKTTIYFDDPPTPWGSECELFPSYMCSPPELKLGRALTDLDLAELRAEFRPSLHLADETSTDFVDRDVRQMFELGWAIAGANRDLTRWIICRLYGDSPTAGRQHAMWDRWERSGGWRVKWRFIDPESPKFGKQGCRESGTIMSAKADHTGGHVFVCVEAGRRVNKWLNAWRQATSPGQRFCVAMDVAGNIVHEVGHLCGMEIWGNHNDQGCDHLYRLSSMFKYAVSHRYRLTLCDAPLCDKFYQNDMWNYPGAKRIG